MVVRDALESLLNPVVLPGVFHTQHVQQQVQVRPQLVRVGEGDLGGGRGRDQGWEGEGWAHSRGREGRGGSSRGREGRGGSIPARGARRARRG